MSLRDYAHHNEDAMHMWWQEEGRFGSEEPDYDPDDYLSDYDDGEYEEADDDEEGPFDDPKPVRLNAFGQRLRDDAPELPGDHYHIPEDAHLEAAYEDRFGYDG